MPAWHGDRQGLGFGNLGDVFGIAETLRRFGLGIVSDVLLLGPDQPGVLGFSPAFCGQVHAGTMPWLRVRMRPRSHSTTAKSGGFSGRWANASAVLGSASRRSASSQPTSYHTFDRPGRDRLITHVFDHQHSPLE